MVDRKLNDIVEEILASIACVISTVKTAYVAAGESQ